MNSPSSLVCQFSSAANRQAGLVGCFFCLVLLFASSSRAGDGWLGIYSEAVVDSAVLADRTGASSLPQGATAAVRVTAVFPDSPAAAGGLLEGDLIFSLNEKPFHGPSDSLRLRFRRALAERWAGESILFGIYRDAVTREGSPAFWRDPKGWVDELEVGRSGAFRAAKDRAWLNLDIELGPRPEAKWPAPPANAQMAPPELYPPSDFAAAAWRLVDNAGIGEDTEDLLGRLASCHDSADPFRLWPVIYAHRDPFRLESLSRHLAADLSSPSVGGTLVAASRWLFTDPLKPSASLPAPTDQADFIAQVDSLLGLAAASVETAFADLGDEDRDFLAKHYLQLLEAFETRVYIDFDEDQERFILNKRLLDLAARVDTRQLVQAAITIAPLTDPDWAKAAGDMFLAAHQVDHDAPVLLDSTTAAGRILVAGTKRNWHRPPDPAFLLDLGGDDFHSGGGGASRPGELPICIHIDLDGDDAWESSEPVAQGAGLLGVGAAVDLSGDDLYLAPMASQGLGYLGVGIMADLSGDDIYRARSFSQAAGLFGLGLLLDVSGEDRYEARVLSQGLGLAGAMGLLRDLTGDDEFFAKGLVPTGYGDPGIFDAWSQGCGMGFRTLASGGLGLLLDDGGSDRFEAGNFAQGGGYYYGMGLLRAAGDGDDTYIGSRYCQGFSAHQALGVFLEESGDDLYDTRQSVAQGLAWDECATLFIDSSGDDEYRGGGGFSQGASAHNSFCFFIDGGGKDSYLYRAGQARAGGNDYHGGTSFSLFVDEGGRDNFFTWKDYPADGRAHHPEHGFFLDLEGRIGEVK